ncbi:hypothetical protein FOA43_000323 [Brettanomyces nanus]|uniref:CMP/dCMP-type deaminase domain-containing protein n=1 Tax=Eeniella nana TaxID=13502 RepID=A0A875RZD0_EENNA|nr:uncharacterized protein FOA43_000323 [Brettanomyces nanus]QPG73019.1 hypothetical protein FOA43_000323 [Brettanomyces nanus]
MKEALKVAQSALSSKEVPVGCVYVYKGHIIGRGFNKTNLTLNGTRHSEFIGYDEIRQTFKDNFREVFKETDLYVTVEPCIMCASLLRQLEIRRVFFGCANERFGGNGSVYQVNTDVCELAEQYHVHTGKTYVSYPGILSREAVILLRNFYILHNDKSPIANDKKHRRLELQNFPILNYSKHLSRAEFTEMFGEQYGFIYDNNDLMTFNDNGRLINKVTDKTMNKRQKVCS